MAFSSQFPHKVVLAARSIKPGFVIQKSLPIFSFQTMQKFRVFHFYLLLDWGHTIRNKWFLRKIDGALRFCISTILHIYFFVNIIFKLSTKIGQCYTWDEITKCCQKVCVRKNFRQSTICGWSSKYKTLMSGTLHN